MMSNTWFLMRVSSTKTAMTSYEAPGCEISISKQGFSIFLIPAPIYGKYPSHDLKVDGDWIYVLSHHALFLCEAGVSLMSIQH